MKQSSISSIEEELAAKQFAQSVVANSVEAMRAMRNLQNKVQQHDIITSSSFSTFSSSIITELNFLFLAMIAEIVAQTLHHQLLFVVQVSANSVAVSIVIRFEKLFDIAEYEGNKDRLNAWKQSLIQRMNVNNDCYFSHCVKIAYAESQLIIGKKAHNLMNQY